MANPKLAMDNPLFKVMVFALVLAVLAYNVMSFSKERGADSRMVDALARLERLSDPTRTIYVYPDMEGMLTWQWADWGGHWNSVCDFGPAPLETPMFKWISMTTPIVLNPKWTPAEYVAYMKKQMDCAFDKGYRVIASHRGLALTRRSAGP